MNRELEIRERVAQYGMALLGADRVEMDATRDNLEFYAYSDLRYLLDETDRLTADLAALTAERDALINVQAQLNGVMCGVRAERDAFKARAEAAVRDMRMFRSCQTCKHKPDRYPSIHGACKDCDDEDKWEWRGPDAGGEGKPE